MVNHCRLYWAIYLAFEGAEKIYEYIIPHEQAVTTKKKIPSKEN
jgi:predicted DNA repair protein MutK